jgi:large subunit ribosomal protein L22
MEKEKTNTEKKKAIVKGLDLPISTKHSMDICKFLRGKKISEAINLVDKASRMEIAVPSKGEIPHKKGIAARYPVKALKVFVKLLKSLAANASQQNVDLEKATIHGKADLASRPHRPGRMGRRRFKRTHVLLVLEEK